MVKRGCPPVLSDQFFSMTESLHLEGLRYKLWQLRSQALSPYFSVAAVRQNIRLANRGGLITTFKKFKFSPKPLIVGRVLGGLGTILGQALLLLSCNGKSYVAIFSALFVCDSRRCPI
jgi:hypothetical protein